VNRQHTDSTTSKQVRDRGGPEPCDHCGADTRPPDVLRQGATATRYLHPSCSQADGAGEIVDAADARRLQTRPGGFGQLRVIA
jgi:hypothetical protein